VSPSLDRDRMLLVGRIIGRAVVAGGAAAVRELAAERERPRSGRLAEAARPAVDRRPRGRAAKLFAPWLHELFLLAFICLTLVALNVDLLLPAAWRPFFRLSCGVVLIVGGLPLAAGTARSRSLVIALLLHRWSKRRSGRPQRHGWAFRLLDPLLQALGVAMLGAAALELVRAVPRLV
jgi:hypothetical protein